MAMTKHVTLSSPKRRGTAGIKIDELERESLVESMESQIIQDLTRSNSMKEHPDEPTYGDEDSATLQNSYLKQLLNQEEILEGQDFRTKKQLGFKSGAKDRIERI